MLQCIYLQIKRDENISQNVCHCVPLCAIFTKTWFKSLLHPWCPGFQESEPRGLLQLCDLCVFARKIFSGSSLTHPPNPIPNGRWILLLSG